MMIMMIMMIMMMIIINITNERTVLCSCGSDIKDKYHNGIMGCPIQIVLCKNQTASVV